MTRIGDVEALLFDLGGVLIELDFPSAFRHWARCAHVSEDHIRTCFRFDDEERLLERYEVGAIDAAEYYAWLRRSLGIDIPDAEFDAGWRSIFPGEVAGVDALVRSIDERLPLYVFSNTNADHQRAWAPRFANLLQPFRRVFTSHELGKRKPTPEAFHAVAQAIDVPPERILFFDDSPTNVAGALAVGMQAVHVQSIADIERAVAPFRRK